MSLYKSTISSNNVSDEDDNISKLKTSIIAFKRLVEKFQKNYNCGEKEKEAVRRLRCNNSF